MTANVGLIGCGHIARFHARNIRDAITRHGIDARYLAVCDRDRTRAETFAAIGGCEIVTERAEDVIEACDIVYVCTETAEHPLLVERAAAARRHLFCEKPLARNLVEARHMADVVEAAGVVNQVGLVLNFSPVYRVLGALMQGNFGALLSVHMRDDQFFPIRGHYGSSWRGDVERAGGGTLLEHSIHDVDLFRWLFGEIRSVQCRTRAAPAFEGIEDVAQVTFEHEDGAVSTLASVWHSIDSRPSSRSLEVIFERARFYTEQDYFGSIVCEIGDSAPVTVSSDEVLARFMAMETLDPSEEDLRSLAGLGDRRFLEAALANRPAHPDFRAALRSHEIVDACYRSAAETGARITLAG